MKKSFYEIAWSLLEKEGLVTKWINEGLLIESRGTLAWSAKTLENLHLKEAVGVLKITTKTDKTSSKEEIEIPWIEEFMFKFSYKKTGIPGKAGDKKAIVKKLTKFMTDYDYTKEELFLAVDLYMDNLLRTNSMKFIQECGYFISKTVDGIITSNLAKWCVEARNGGNTQRYTSHNVL